MNAISSKGGSGVGSLICFLGLMTIAGHASERGWSPLWLTLLVVLSLCYLWKFLSSRSELACEREDRIKRKATNHSLEPSADDAANSAVRPTPQADGDSVHGP